MAGRLHIERDGPIGRLIFDQQARRNALTAEMWDAVPEAALELSNDPSIRVVVMRGAGDVAFVSGADISEFESNRIGPEAEVYDRRNARAFAALLGIAKPVVALVHGFCIGGGCALALCADLRYAADDAVFAIPAARLGLGYGADGLEQLARVVGQPAAREIFFTARRLSADEALRVGLVNAVLPKPELDAHVDRVVRGIASNAPLTLRSAKLAFQQMALPPAERDRDLIVDSIQRCYASDDYAEGVRAFLDKRKPEFRGH